MLDSADGVDLRREVGTGTWAVGPVGGSSSLGVRQVQRPDGTSFHVVELIVSGERAASTGIQVNGVGLMAEGAKGAEATARWAVATRHDAELLLAAIAASLAPVVGGRVSLPQPTESVLARTASAGVLGPVGPVPGLTSASGSVALRGEVTTTRSGSTTYAASISGAGAAGLLAVVGTGAAGSVKVSVTRDGSGVVTRASVSTTTEVDRGQHGTRCSKRATARAPWSRGSGRSSSRPSAGRPPIGSLPPSVGARPPTRPTCRSSAEPT